MSLSDTDVKATYNGTGAQTTFAIPFAPIVDDSAETKVYIRDATDPNDITVTLQVEGALNDYTLTGAPDAESFNVNVEFNTAPTANQKVIIARELPLTQTLDQSPNASFLPASQETAFDRLVAMIQQVNEKVERSLRAGITEQLSDSGYELPDPVAGNVFGWNSAATGITHYSPANIASAGSGGIQDTDDLAEGATNLYFTTARATTNFNNNFAFVTLNSISDVTETATADGDILYNHSGTLWRNAAPGLIRYRSTTTPASATDADEVIVLTGASGTLALQTAVISQGNRRRLRIVHGGTSITQAYTIDPNAAETIGGVATKVLRFNGEEIVIVKDGTSNWVIEQHTVPFVDAEIYLETSNGYGSTNTQIRRYTDTRRDTSAGVMTYTDSSTLGGNITVNVAGIYEIATKDGNTGAASNIGICINGTALTTAIETVTYAQGLRAHTGTVSARGGQVTIAIFLNSGDIIRAHHGATLPNFTTSAMFKVSLVAPRLG